VVHLTELHSQATELLLLNKGTAACQSRHMGLQCNSKHTTTMHQPSSKNQRQKHRNLKA